MFKRIGRSHSPALPSGRETIQLPSTGRRWSVFWARLSLSMILGVPFVGFLSLLVSQITTGEFAETQVLDTAVATPDVAAFLANDSRVLDAQAEAEATRIALLAQRDEAEAALAEFDQKLAQADQQQREALLRERQRIENGFVQLQLDVERNNEELRVLRERLAAQNVAQAEEVRLAATAEASRVQAIRNEAAALDELARTRQQAMWANSAEVLASALTWISVAFVIITGLIIAVAVGIVTVAWVQIQIENWHIARAHRNALPPPPQPRRERTRHEEEATPPPPQPPAVDYATVEELMREWQAAALRRREDPPTPANPEPQRPSSVNTTVNRDLPEVETVVNERVNTVNGRVNTVNGGINDAVNTVNGAVNGEVNELIERYIPRERWGELPLSGEVPSWAQHIMADMLNDGVSRTRICTAFYNSTGNNYTRYVKPLLDSFSEE